MVKSLKKSRPPTPNLRESVLDHFAVLRLPVQLVLVISGIGHHFTGRSEHFRYGITGLLFLHGRIER